MTSTEPGGYLDGRGNRLAGLGALVSGAGSSGDFLGTRAATAALFAVQGALTGVLDVSPERAAATCELIKRHGGTAIALTADITDADAVRAAVEAFTAAAGRLDVVVNNTGISAGEWDQVFAVDAKGTMLVSEAAHPHLVRSPAASVINVSTVAALRGFGGGAYAASKGAVLSMTTDYAYRWGPDGIRVNCLVPGHLNTPIGNQGGAGAREARRKANLLGTEGDAWDLAWAALFLAGPESRFITGVTLPVDAGTTMATGLAMLGRRTSCSPRATREPTLRPVHTIPVTDHDAHGNKPDR
ncbi:SDR family NAD(P)-dependent oxidoreductase [Amycolatopsis sp. NBC_01480]|uniref:SDR family NAD(P)-dependent oxidoreductase n=1 Tax=Amycolatopsis sp. NBC_01480 TaxID=2903562 RepID=UPI002E2AEDEB|nr:SDR family oxidoreductase [Amycolatopsis sp. NBC_01480]